MAKKGTEQQGRKVIGRAEAVSESDGNLAAIVKAAFHAKPLFERSAMVARETFSSTWSKACQQELERPDCTFEEATQWLALLQSDAKIHSFILFNRSMSPRDFVQRFVELMSEQEELLGRSTAIARSPSTRQFFVCGLSGWKAVLAELTNSDAGREKDIQTIARYFLGLAETALAFEASLGGGNDVHGSIALGFDNPGKAEIKDEITPSYLKKNLPHEQTPPTEKQDVVLTGGDAISPEELRSGPEGRDLTSEDFSDAIARAFDITKFRTEGVIRGIKVGGVTVELRLETTSLRDEWAQLVEKNVPPDGKYYSKRENKEDDADKFFYDVYGRFHSAGIVYMNSLRKLDPALVSRLNKLPAISPPIPRIVDSTKKRLAKIAEQDPTMARVLKHVYRKAK